MEHQVTIAAPPWVKPSASAQRIAALTLQLKSSPSPLGQQRKKI
jgi:hypothetical protein